MLIFKIWIGIIAMSFYYFQGSANKNARALNSSGQICLQTAHQRLKSAKTEIVQSTRKTRQALAAEGLAGS